MIKTLLDCRLRIATGAIILLLIAGVATGFANVKRAIQITADGKTIQLVTDNGSLAGVLREANITLGAYDGVLIDTKRVKEGSKIEVIRAFPITINNQGNEITVTSGQPTVKDVLKQAKVSYSGVDVYPHMDERPRPGETIYVLAPGENIVTQEQAINFAVKEEPDYNSLFGQRKVVQAGHPGKKMIVYKEVNGVRTPLCERILAQPKEEIVRAGRVGTITTNRGVFKYKQMYSMEATAYTPDLNGYGTGYTATGVKCAPGQVAVDPRVIPLGSKVYVEGYGHAVATDTGGAIQGNRIDVVIATIGEAYQFGRRNVKVYLLEE